MKIKWKVDPVPTGRFRSFSTRAWPDAEYENGDTAAHIICEKEYVPADVRSGNYPPLTLRVAKWYTKEERGDRAAFEWMRFKRKFTTLKEAKQFAGEWLNRHPEYWPESLRNKPEPTPCPYCGKRWIHADNCKHPNWKRR